MTHPIIPASAIADIDGEPRIRDLTLADYLGLVKAHDVRAMIVRNWSELSLHGNFPHRAEKSEGRGRPGTAYYLNEGQALVICALSRTEKAAEIRKQIIDVFRAYRSGELQPAEEKPVHVVEHKRRLPTRVLRSAEISFIGLASHDCKVADVTLRMPMGVACEVMKALVKS